MWQAPGTLPGLAAQDKPPESPARLGLPEDPEEVPRLVLASGLPIIHVFEADCPSEGGWGAAALAALEEAAETDTVLRSQLANTLGARVLARDLCLSDLPRFESWLADQHFDEAARRIVRRLRFSPALMCNKPVRDVVQYSLRFYPSHRDRARRSPSDEIGISRASNRSVARTVAKYASMAR